MRRGLLSNHLWPTPVRSRVFVREKGVTFSNASTSAYTDSFWAFGDGGTSTEADPTYTYTVTGSYTVTLTVSGPGGSDTETKPGYIRVAPVRDRVHLPVVVRNP